ncbi:MAG: serine/threonine-protein kinase [Planctomycetota bacterium]
MNSKLPPASLREINEICDRFEDQWLAGEIPSLADFAIQDDSELAAQLFSDLLDLHLHYSNQRNLDPALQTLEESLPEFKSQLIAKRQELAPTSERDTLDFSIADTLLGEESLPDSDETDVPQLERYKILETLGQGAMGAVYLAEDQTLGRNVALKTPALKEQTEASVERFFREAKAAAGLQHRNICPVYDVGKEGNTLFLTMAHIKGQSLGELLKSAIEFSAEETARLMQRIATALQSAHHEGIVHRDLKPANIMIDHENEPVVMDFGLARQANLDDATQLTQSGMILGTPAYMSPEQLHDSASAGPAADIYSLGVVMYQVLTGELPFKGSIMSVVTKIVSQPPQQPSELAPNVDAELERICLKAMAKTPADRFASMQEFADALASYRKTAANSDARETAVESHPQPSTRAHGIDKGAGHRSTKIPTLIGAALVVAAAFYGVILLIPTPNGTIRIQVEDPGLDVIVNSTGAKIQGDQQVLSLKPGDQSFLITRGDFEFETDSFILRKNDQVQLKIDWIQGELVAKKDGRAIGTRVVGSPQADPPEIEPKASAVREEPSRNITRPTPKEFADGNALLDHLRTNAGTFELTENRDGAYQMMTIEDDWTEIQTEPCSVTLPPGFGLNAANMAVLLKRLPGLHTLTIDGSTFDPAAIELVNGSTIRKLSFERNQGLPAGTIEQIAQVKTIDELHLYDCGIQDDDLNKISSLTQLKVLQIGINPITQAGYKHLRALKSLVGLLAGTADEKDPSAAGALFAALEGCKQLEYLG